MKQPRPIRQVDIDHAFHIHRRNVVGVTRDIEVLQLAASALGITLLAESLSAIRHSLCGTLQEHANLLKVAEVGRIDDEASS